MNDLDTSVDLHKITLYMADHHNVGVEALKMEIERALNGIAFNTTIQFADEHSAAVRWSDEIDINHLNAKSETWDKYFK
jgi:hypothetical protein